MAPKQLFNDRIKIGRRRGRDRNRTKHNFKTETPFPGNGAKNLLANSQVHESQVIKMVFFEDSSVESTGKGKFLNHV